MVTLLVLLRLHQTYSPHFFWKQGDNKSSFAFSEVKTLLSQGKTENPVERQHPPAGEKRYQLCRPDLLYCMTLTTPPAAGSGGTWDIKQWPVCHVPVWCGLSDQTPQHISAELPIVSGQHIWPEQTTLKTKLWGNDLLRRTSPLALVSCNVQRHRSEPDIYDRLQPSVQWFVTNWQWHAIWRTSTLVPSSGMSLSGEIDWKCICGCAVWFGCNCSASLALCLSSVNANGTDQSWLFIQQAESLQYINMQTCTTKGPLRLCLSLWLWLCQCVCD
jgi:hypothetical protein